MSKALLNLWNGGIASNLSIRINLRKISHRKRHNKLRKDRFLRRVKGSQTKTKTIMKKIINIEERILIVSKRLTIILILTSKKCDCFI